MTRLVTLTVAATFCIGSLVAAGRGAYATPPADLPEPAAVAAMASLVADGVVEGNPDATYRTQRPATRTEMAKSVARAIAKLRTKGAAAVSKADLETLQTLAYSLKDELVLQGVRDTNLDDIANPKKKTAYAHSYAVHGQIFADGSFRRRNGTPLTPTGGAVDPFVNAFLTSPVDGNGFAHEPGASNVLRFDNKLIPTLTIDDNLALSLPIHMTEYNGAFAVQDRYLLEPALVLNIAKLGAIRNAYVHVGQLDNLESSRLGLTYRAPDATQQGPGYQNAVQPYENGLSLGGALNGLTHFQVSFARVEDSPIDTIGSLPNNFFQVVTPSQNSFVQPGAPNSSAPTTRIDTFTAAAGPVPAVSLSMKAALGTVYIATINGVTCNSAGQRVFGGGPCPISGSAWYYLDQTNQVVFKSLLPTGTVVQIGYSLTGTTVGSQSYNYQFQRYHFNARLNQEIKGVPGGEIGFSASRLFDAGNLLGSAGVPFGNGYGRLSDTVVGLDARLPLRFFTLRGDGSHPVLFAEAAFSKYTPDFHNTPAITDSALAAGFRLTRFGAAATVQYQAVGPDFVDGGPIRYLGPAPSTFQTWHGAFFPQFFGFANNLAINQVFDTTVTPGCSGAVCSRNRLSYIYPLFNPFVANGPQYYSAFAPNSRGLTTTITAPIDFGNYVVGTRLRVQHLQELQPNSYGQITYGPGFSSRVGMNFDTVEGGVQFGIPLGDRKATVNVSASGEHLSRIDLTAYSYTPFNPMTGGPDAASGAALTTYLSSPGNTPVLFFPNYADVHHTTLDAGLTLPVTRELNFGLGYNAQIYHGAYATIPGAVNSSNLAVIPRDSLTQRRSNLNGTLTYTIPKTLSSIGVLFGNQKYTDGTLPTFNFSQNRADVTFSSRF